MIFQSKCWPENRACHCEILLVCSAGSLGSRPQNSLPKPAWPKLAGACCLLEITWRTLPFLWAIEVLTYLVRHSNATSEFGQADFGMDRNFRRRSSGKGRIGKAG